MKLNKTLTMMKELNNSGSTLTIYGRKQFDRILNFKDVESCDTNGNSLSFKLSDGSTIEATYQEWC